MENNAILGQWDGKRTTLGQSLGVLSGMAGLLGLVLPLIRIELDAFGIALSRTSATIWDIADIVEMLGDDPYGIYILATLIGIGSILIIIGAFASRSTQVVGLLLQLLSIGFLLYEIHVGGYTAFGIEISTSPHFGLYILLMAPILGIASVLVDLST